MNGSRPLDLDRILDEQGFSTEQIATAKAVVLIRHKVFAGNISDCKTLIEAVAGLEETGSSSKPVVIVDGGMATDKNLRTLRERGYDYIVCAALLILKTGNSGNSPAMNAPGAPSVGGSTPMAMRP